MKNINEIVLHIKNILNVNVIIDNSKINFSKSVPLAIKSRYNMYTLKIENIDSIVLVCKEDIQSIKKHLSLFNEAIDLPIIVAIENINTSIRKYLIENHIPFISKESIYLPQLLIYLNNLDDRYKKIKNKKLSKLAQTILISSLFNRKYIDKDYEMDIETSSHLWNVTKMSSSRALNELVEFEYLTNSTLGRKKYYFIKENIDIDKLLKDIRNPIINTIYIKVKDLIYFEKKVEASYTALSKYTNITDNKIVYAIEKNYFDKVIKKDNEITIYDDEYDNDLIQIELWRYEPYMNLINNNNIVDKISLYISLKNKIDIEDSRLNEAINELYNQIKGMC
jgi:hypothetical protein